MTETKLIQDISYYLVYTDFEGLPRVYYLTSEQASLALALEDKIVNADEIPQDHVDAFIEVLDGLDESKPVVMSKTIFNNARFINVGWAL